MRIAKKILSMALAFVMALGLLPAASLAAGEEGYVYLSISFDGQYIDDKNGNPIVYMPISLEDIASIDLAEYGLENMLYDADGDENYETTALQLIIYAHEELYGGIWENVDFDAIPGGSYFNDGVFGFTENLVYFLNGDFPLKADQTNPNMKTGATSDEIVLEAGDFLDLASFSCYQFLWDPAGGFHLFADENDNYIHDYTVEKDETLSFKLKHSFCSLEDGAAWVYDATDYEVFYGTVFGEADGSVTTNESGCAEIAFPDAGTYYLWCYGANSPDEWGMHGSCDYTTEHGIPCVVSAPAYAKVTVTGGEVPEAPTPEQPTPEQPRQPQDVSAVLNATMAQLAKTVTAPAFGTNAGEWTVFGLARGNYFTKDNTYFTDYYERIMEYVNTTAAAVGKNGALDKNKSTDNSRLIVALSAIGKDATSVGDWDLVEAYSANGFNWIKKQGMNGTIWTLIALDSDDYETSDPTIRQACVDSLLSLQHDDGGWSLMFDTTLPSNVDITGMTLTALYPYRDQPKVAAACEEALAWLSESQLDNGGFPYGSNGETSESCVWAIVAATTWGINPDTDPRFIKNDKSAVDNLLSYYVEDEAMFAHQGTEANNMATDQATYALVAYDRLINDKAALYDYSDVTFDAAADKPETPSAKEMAATLGVQGKIENKIGTTFNGVITISNWDNTAGHKLIDFIVSVPACLDVTEVKTGNAVTGGEVRYHLEKDTGKLRIVYFDAMENNSITVTGSNAAPEFFTIGFEQIQAVSNGQKVEIAITGMSVKSSADSSKEGAQVVVNTDAAKGTVEFTGTSFSAVCLYEGDGVDLIPKDKKAVAVAVTGIDAGVEITFRHDNKEIELSYSPEISQKTGVGTYVAMVAAEIPMEAFVDAKNYEIAETTAEEITFGDANEDGVVNAQDALAAVDAWLRKSEAPNDDKILRLNVNGDSRINTYDALGIVENFVNGNDFGVVTKAATVATKQN